MTLPANLQKPRAVKRVVDFANIPQDPVKTPPNVEIPGSSASKPSNNGLEKPAMNSKVSKPTAQKKTPLNLRSLNSIYRRLCFDKHKGDKTKITMLTLMVLHLSEVPIYFFTLLDILKLKSLFKYRLHYNSDHVSHLGVRKYPPLKVVLNAAKVSEFNYLFAYCMPAYVMLKIACKLGIFVYDTEESEKKVTWKRLFAEVTVISILADTAFYWMHRWMHTPGMYLKHHKMHHEFKYTIAMAHHWMTYAESCMFMLPQALPPLLIWAATGRKCHVLSLWAGMFFTQINGIFGHAGYRLDFIPKWLPFFQASYHDYHHVDYMANFGAIFPMVDIVFGTYVNAKLERNMTKVMENVKKPRVFK